MEHIHPPQEDPQWELTRWRLAISRFVLQRVEFCSALSKRLIRCSYMHIKGQVSSEGDKCGFSVMFKNVTALILMQKLGYGELGEEHFEKMRFYISVLYFKVAVN